MPRTLVLRAQGDGVLMLATTATDEEDVTMRSFRTRRRANQHFVRCHLRLSASTTAVLFCAALCTLSLVTPTKLLAQKIYWEAHGIHVGDLDRVTGEVTNVEAVDVVDGAFDFAVVDNKIYWITTIFVGPEFNPLSVIFGANQDGSGKTLLANLSHVESTSSEIAANQERIVWTEGQFQLWTADLNGGGKTLLLEGAAFNFIFDAELGEITPQGTEVIWSGVDELGTSFVRRGIINGDLTSKSLTSRRWQTDFQ